VLTPRSCARRLIARCIDSDRRQEVLRPSTGANDSSLPPCSIRTTARGRPAASYVVTPGLGPCPCSMPESSQRRVRPVSVAHGKMSP
jgi:hypothetical protein